MTNEEMNTRLVKAAAMGYAQSLMNRGFNSEAVLNATNAYTNPQSGMLQKRASDRVQYVKTVVYNAIMGK